MRFVWILTLLVACGKGEEGAAPSETAGADARSKLLNPHLANETAPEKFRAKFTTTKGDFIIESQRKWSPHGVDRLYNLIRIGYFRDVPFYRIVPGFIAQFGFTWDPKINLAWNNATIPDDPNRVGNMRGHIAFGQRRGKDTRTCQLFINLNNNERALDRQGFPTVARIVEGWEVVGELNAEYGEKPSQSRIANEGLPYLEKEFPRLDYIKSAELLD
ncbi:MAG: peptidylprolyl isomerase [Planctomycetota bacterium]|jgi:peptidyl-prolyl cis-trans isomerase A (cyclophilin A)